MGAVVPSPRRRLPAGRPSLSEQLAACSASSDTIIADMKKTFKSRFDREGLLLEVPTRYLHVGRCESQFGGIARFFSHEVVYAFEHPHHRHVEMHMRYADMAQPSTAPMGRGVGRGRGRGAPEFRFRIVNELAYFTREYDPTNPAHRLAIGFTTSADLRRVEAEVYPCVVAAAGGGGAAGGAPAAQPLQSAGSLGRVGTRR